jgi:hypothetical protein
MKTLVLKPLYNKALDGLPLLGTPAQTAGRYLVGKGTLEERAADMATVHIALSASTGFVCGLGGFLTLPITLPTNLAGVALLQLHLCASTAFMANLDPYDPEVRGRCFDCLTGIGQAGVDRDETQEVMDRSAVKVAERGVRLLAETAVGLASRAGEWTATRFIKRQLPRRSLPLVGGVIGSVSDLYATRRVAEAARTTFLSPPGVPLPVTRVASGNGVH